ncbi:MAG: hypothetical protein RLY23_1847 [Actinomycetota bacterium]
MTDSKKNNSTTKKNNASKKAAPKTTGPSPAVIRAKLEALRERAREATVESARLHLLGQGLDNLIQRFRDPSDPEAPVISIPNTQPFVAVLEASALSSWLAANRAGLIAREIELGSEPDFDAILHAVQESENHYAAAAATLRALATALLGVTSQNGDNDEIHFCEHAAAIALALASQNGERFGSDQWVLQGSTRAELVTEVAGICCRFLCEDFDDEHSYAAFETPSGSWVSLEGDPRGIVVMTNDSGHELTLDVGTRALLDRIGWTESSLQGDVLLATADFTENPVTSEIAALVASTLFDVYGIDDASILERRSTLVPSDTLD